MSSITFAMCRLRLYLYCFLGSTFRSSSNSILCFSPYLYWTSEPIPISFIWYSLISTAGHNCSVQIPCTLQNTVLSPKACFFLSCLLIPMDNREERGYRGTGNKLRVQSNGGGHLMLRTTRHLHIWNNKMVLGIFLYLMPGI